jgi:hypothetical protein
MTEIAQWGNLSPKLLHDLETHYHNIEMLYNDNIDLEEIRIGLEIPYEEWLPMEDIIFATQSIYRVKNIFRKTKFYRSHNKTNYTEEVKMINKPGEPYAYK